ncbi:hypothetical protein FRP1_30400 (plasmid) [Pseudonocardia sp. EC080625-04]|nr:hypothetical protein FRP1_18940 [Pseudonocardia sp. EC080625-04]ALE77016.1 hypothetical protein FRP1_30400 [Pseudonocardia sp. EC080625-04]
MTSHDTRPPWWSTDPQSTAWATPRPVGAPDNTDHDTGAHEAREAREAREEISTDAAPSPSPELQPSGREASAARHWTRRPATAWLTVTVTPAMTVASTTPNRPTPTLRSRGLRR